MTIRVESVCIDASDPKGLSRFWSELLGWEVAEEDEDSVVLRGDGTFLDFFKVPEAKSAVKNRLHLDLRPDDRDAEVARAEALGARRVDIGQGDDVSWVVLADPEGNEFCILQAS
jgi:predicted enzyme related to lactoylglutathione lyase